MDHFPVPDEGVQRTIIGQISPDLLAWFEQQGLVRVSVTVEPDGTIAEIVAPPLILLGRGLDQVITCPDPTEYPATAPLATMALDDYHIFLARWLTTLIDQVEVRCLVCQQRVSNADPDNPWDGIFVDADFLGWLVMHFDCKRGLQREFKGRHPFELRPQPAPYLTLATDE